tara:strand:- start:417 stop:1115 length:699 start_codon:yes stop_codon:yes gene_type:complete
VTKISVIIPCYNEKNTIIQLIDVLNNLQVNKQIILVDDYSNDGTREIIEKNLTKKVDNVIFHEKNLGKGACVKTAKEFILGDIVIIQDADLEYDPNDYNNLIKPILEKKTNVVYGSRVLNKFAIPNRSFISNFRIFGNYLLTKFSNFINNQKLTDAHTCYKVLTKEVFNKIILKENGFNFCPEITTKLAILNEKILEIPINYNGRSIEEGKKIRFWHALEALYTLIKYNFFK